MMKFGRNFDGHKTELKYQTRSKITDATDDFRVKKGHNFFVYLIPWGPRKAEILEASIALCRAV